VGWRDWRSNGILERRENEADVLMTGVIPGFTGVRILNEENISQPIFRGAICATISTLNLCIRTELRSLSIFKSMSSDSRRILDVKDFRTCQQ
jgi:hypothetical protein